MSLTDSDYPRLDMVREWRPISGGSSWLGANLVSRAYAQGLDPVIPPIPQSVLEGLATRYGGGAAWGDSVDFNGGALACGGVYSSWDDSIAAVGPSRYADWPCGTPFYICGPAGCAQVFRRDSCPGCSANHLDLSEVAHQKVCGVGTCPITIKVGYEHD